MGIEHGNYNKDFNADAALEKKEKVVLRVIINRHGPKKEAAGENNFVADYFTNSVKKGFHKMGVEKGKGLAHVASSPIDRAMHSADIELNELKATEHRLKSHIIKKDCLKTPFQAGDEKYLEDYTTIVKMQKNLEPGVREEVESELPDLETTERESEIRNRIDTAILTQMFNEYSEDPQDRKFQITYHELADSFAERYLGFSKHLDLLNKKKQYSDIQPLEEPYLQIDVSHSYPITAFLKKYLVFEDGNDGENMKPEIFFKRTGGVIRESGSLQMDFIITEDKPIIKLEAEFMEGRKFSGTIKL